jgi:hypothetical protein
MEIHGEMVMTKTFESKSVSSKGTTTKSNQGQVKTIEVRFGCLEVLMMSTIAQRKPSLGLNNPKEQDEPTFLNSNPSLGIFGEWGL